MKRPVILTFAIIFTVAAIAVFAVLVSSLSGRVDFMSFLTKGFSNVTSGELVKEESFDTAGLNNLYINARDQKVELILTDGDKITVRHYDYSDAVPFTATATTNRLEIELKANLRIMSFSAVLPRLEISIPRSYTGSVSASTGSGSIVCDNEAKWDVVALEAKSGGIRFPGGITCSALSAVTGSGSIRIGGIDASDNVSLYTASGGIHAGEGIECTGFSAETGSGTISLGDVEINGNGTAMLSTRSGGLRVGELTAISGYSLSTGSGSIRIDGLKGKGVVSTHSGGISCNDLAVTGDTDITSGSGSVRVTLDEVKNLNMEISTGSGSRRTGEYNFNYDSSGKRGTCTVGDGSTGTLKIKTSSGSIVIS